MRFIQLILKMCVLLMALAVTGCAGLGGGESSAHAGSDSKSKALAALDRPKFGPKGLFDPQAPKRRIQSLVVVGDSISISLGSELEKMVAEKPGLRFARLGKVSSGLARPDFFDWDRHMEDMARRHRPDAVVVMLGTNDNKHLRNPDGSQVTYRSPEWERGYAARVRRIIEICRTYNPDATVFWMGSPVTADGDLNRDLRHINALVRRTVSSQKDCYYVDTWSLFSAQDGGFAFSKPDVENGATLRARDGIHMTTAGAQALAGFCLGVLENRIYWDPPSQPKQEQASQGNSGA
ncbi:MAG: DUF459 domain-containing protein [Acidobacteriota bacterium]